MRNNNSNMVSSTQRRSLVYLLGLCLLLFETVSTNAQTKRASRITNSRSFGTTIKGTSSNGVSFDCPEEFGYYPHPTDCTQYYVCVFGGALLESCTGGLMYSHELQTCDWPRNVGCELVDSGTSATSTEVGDASRNKAQHQQHQHVPSRIRFGSAFNNQAATPKAVTVPPQYHRSPPQIIQAEVQHIPPPPELRVPPNPVVTSRGQPKSVLDSQEEIAKLYAEVQETLPSIEEEESDRQQRVYRGQPSTVSQVQRDRDGIIHQANINAIPNHGKIGSYTFGTAYSESLDNDVTIGRELSHNRLQVDKIRKIRDVSRQESTTRAETIVTTDSNNFDEALKPTRIELYKGKLTNSSSNSDTSENNLVAEEPIVTEAHKYSSKIIQAQNNYAYDEADYEKANDDNDTEESRRRPRQLRPFQRGSSNWPAHNYRSIDTPSAQPYIQRNGYSFGSFNPYLTPPSQQTHPNHNYNQVSPNSAYKSYIQQQQLQPQQQQLEQSSTYRQKPTVLYTSYNLSLPPPPVEDDFRPIAGNYYATASSTSPRPPVKYQEPSSQTGLLPYLIQQLKELKEKRKQIQTENFAYFHLDNQPISPTQVPPLSTTQRTSQITPNNHYAQYSTMGGFYNNKPEKGTNTPSYPAKLVSQYTIGQGQDPHSSTESNYFQYNIIANQKMKGVYSTTKLNEIGHTAIKVHPPVTPLDVTPNFSIISAPNLAYNKPTELQQISYKDLNHLPIGITYASNTTMPESYQTFTKSINSTPYPKMEASKPITTTQPPMTNFEFDINEFMANLKSSDLASFNPAVNPLIKYFKQVSNDGNVRNALILRRPVSSTSPRPIVKIKSTGVTVSTSPPAMTANTREFKGYENFVNSIQAHLNKQKFFSNISTTTSVPRKKINSSSTTTTTEKMIEYYDEDYDDGIDEDILPPSRMPPYMPMSETMAPPRQQVTTAGPTTVVPYKMRPIFQTGVMQATTTRRPFSNFAQLNQSNSGTEVPAFIKFPSDIFQELKQRLPQLQGSAKDLTSLNVSVTNGRHTNTSMILPVQQNMRNSVRPQHTRGQQKWQPQIGANQEGLDMHQNDGNRGGYIKSSGSVGDFGGHQLNSIHSGANTDRQRVESSSPSSTAQTSDNIFVQPSSQAPPPLLTSNRNYYNTSIFNHGGGYQTQQAQQQQPTPFQQPQQQQQAHALPSSYDSSYYSVYDDDIDLYRDIEYQQQQQQQQPQSYQSTVRQQQSSTYRPLEVLTTITPAQKPIYNKATTLSYNTDYVEDLNAQIEQDNVYDQPTRTPQRAEDVTIQTLDVRPIASTTSNPTATQDARNYYDTITNPHVGYEEGDFNYSNSAEYAQNSSEEYYQSARNPVRSSQNKGASPVDSHDYYLIANDVTQATASTKAGQSKKYTTTRTPTMKTSPVTSRSTTKITTTTTQTVTKPPSTTTTLQSSSSKAHANKNFKQNVIIKLKTTTTPRTTQAPSTTTTTTSTTMPPPTTLSSTYDSNPFLKSKLQVLTKSLSSALRVSENMKNTQVQVTVPLPQISEEWSLVESSANSSTPDHIETVYDESQNVHVQTAENPSGRNLETSTPAKFLDFINAEAYGTNNLVRSPNGKSAKESIYDEFEKFQSIPSQQNQNNRIKTYVISDVAPQSFKKTVSGKLETELLRSSSTTKPNNMYQSNLQSEQRDFHIKADNTFNAKNVSDQLFERTDNGYLQKSSTTITTTTKSTTKAHLVSTQTHHNFEGYENIIPTTYAPLRIWKNGRPTIKQTHITPLMLPTTIATELTKGPIQKSSTTKPQLSFNTSTERLSAGQGFTVRASILKDNLNRATTNPGMKFVSPYKSLESLLQDERLSYNNLRVSSRSRYANNPQSNPFLQTTPKSTKNYFVIAAPQKNSTQSIITTMVTGNTRNFSISDAILSTFSPQKKALVETMRVITPSTADTATTINIPTEAALTTSILPPTPTVVTSSAVQFSESQVRSRGRSRYSAATVNYNLDGIDEPTTYAPKLRMSNSYELRSSTLNPYIRRKTYRTRVVSGHRQTVSDHIPKTKEKYENFKPIEEAKDVDYTFQIATSAPKPKTAKAAIPHSLKRNSIENEATIRDTPHAEALIAHLLEVTQDNSIELRASTRASPVANGESSSTEHVVVITDRPSVKYLYSNKYRQQTAERTLAESLQNAGYIATGNARAKFRSSNVLEQLEQFLAGSDSDESESPQFVDEFSVPEIKAAVNEIKQLYVLKNQNLTRTPTKIATTTSDTTTTPVLLSTTRPPHLASKIGNLSQSLLFQQSPTFSMLVTYPIIVNSSSSVISTTPTTSTNSTSSIFTPPTTRVSRVNNAIKSSIAAAAAQSSSPSSTSATYQVTGGRANKFQYGFAPNSNNNQHQYNNNAAAGAISVKCSDSTLSTKCNEIPSRNNNRNRGSAIYTNQDRDVVAAPNRGTHPPRTRPTLKPSGTIVSKAQEFMDIYRNLPSRPEPLYPQPTPDKTAAKCRKDVCLLPDCYCGGKDIPAELPVESVPQIVLLTFDDSVNDLNRQLYTDLFEKGRANPNGCPITATFYVSHEWTDYSQVQNLYADGHEMASHTVSHSFGEQFSQKKWTREIAGQREILAAYGGVKLSDVRGMRAPFLSVGGNKMYKMLYDSNFTYDSSMPVYENRPPSWPYTLDYKIFHDCMIPPCPTRSYPGVWQVPMVMWQDLNGGRCSMGDACSNPSDAEGVTKMITKNFERHYTTNRAPFGLFYHAAWFTQPHHKEGFIKFLDAINAMPDVWIVTNWQALQWVRDPTPISRINSFQPFQCDYSDRPKRCNNPKVCNLWHKSGVRYMKTCQPCPDIYPWTGKSGIRSSRIDNDIEENPA